MTPTAGRRLPPAGLLLFLGYAFLVLALIGISLRWVVDQAISAPLSIPGIVAMVLLAYTIFTITMVLQRKQAARGLALGLSTLTIPAVPLLLLGPVPAVAFAPAVLGVLLLLGLTRPSVRAWLSED
jgi:FtsH-binding integral membrane protein